MVKKSVFISGASRGIGRACAEYLAMRDYRVFASVRNRDDGTKLQESIDGQIEPILMDLEQQESIEQAIKELTLKLDDKGLDGLINNAGIAVAGPLEFLPLDRVRSMFEINFFGALSLTQKALPLLRKCKGRLINITSMEAGVSIPLNSVYSASKCALEALSDSLRIELSKTGVKVIIVRPGFTKTDIVSTGIADFDEIIEQLPESERDYREMGKAVVSLASKKGFEHASEPEAVAKTVFEALKARSPKTLYSVGMDAHLSRFLECFFPDSWSDWVMKKQIGLDG